MLLKGLGIKRKQLLQKGVAEGGVWGLRGEGMTGGWGTAHNMEVHNLNFSSNNIRGFCFFSLTVRLDSILVNNQPDFPSKPAH